MQQKVSFLSPVLHLTSYTETKTTGTYEFSSSVFFRLCNFSVISKENIKLDIKYFHLNTLYFIKPNKIKIYSGTRNSAHRAKVDQHEIKCVLCFLICTLFVFGTSSGFFPQLLFTPF